MRAAGKPDPRFFDNGVEFTVTLLRANRYDDIELEWLSSVPGSTSWMQKEILVGLLRGETWSSYRAFQEFKQAKEKEVRSAITDLLHRGLLEETNSEWVLADALLGAETPQPKTKQHNLAHIATLGANTEAIFRAVSAGKQAVSEIMASTGLSENQVRYGLKQLVEAHEIAMIGGRGVRGTRYQALLS